MEAKTCLTENIMVQWDNAKHIECSLFMQTEGRLLLSVSICPLEKNHYFNVMYGLTYTAEESRERTDILEVAQDALEVALNDIILGKKSIDTYDAAIKQAKDNGYDRYIEIVQGAYDRYMAKLDK